ncbi:transcription-repair coupling factor [Marinilabilia salmonicolor]|uniref:Transcription-repair-coupling factor n=1 Tax=Marinilabilia salmonicolor TaxID=989 RepID=A0A2T0XTW0_9BACT|nr:transcription-repair coupling factor [Marinilabilia salmonicolor]PRZ02326.1 transcription-repair coupling factor (superfamily II helicase) [Marinilabilia salmonicolor]RCW30571.1 transcription-repair coupling factor (superfamily II helicase) [Marinilabilia salmonicolor]
MEISTLPAIFGNHTSLQEIKKWTQSPDGNLTLKGLSGSSAALLAAAASDKSKHLFILEDKEEAAYFYHDLVQLSGEERIFFLPSTYKRSPEFGQPDSNNTILRTEALEQLQNPDCYTLIVTHSEALMEKVPTRTDLTGQSMTIKTGDSLDPSFVEDFLQELSFQRVDFVYEPGQYSLRGSIIDIFSFSNEDPVRVDFFGDEVESIRTFDIENQLSKKALSQVTLLPDLGKIGDGKEYITLPAFLDKETKIWIQSPRQVFQKTETIFKKVETKYHQKDKAEEVSGLPSPENLVSPKELRSALEDFPVINWGSIHSKDITGPVIEFQTSPQPVFKKNFDLLEKDILSKQGEGYRILILSDNPRQLDRLRQIFEDRGKSLRYEEINHALHEGFIDHELKLCVYTDHQIFDRYHKFSLRTDKVRAARQSLSIKELTRLNPGDYVVHIDHGVGRFGGLVSSEVNGQQQEAIKLIYRDNDVILVNIHSLHRISKFKGKDGEPPKINKLGTGAWQRVKDKTKKKVKDIARELIALYAARKAQPGFSFSADNFMQKELEASFIYEDTPDQNKATQAIKGDMEEKTPMDRLVCGDVGFGKTELAVRAAFKAVTDNKQVAVLVPTTILALQHYHTFRERLKDFPCNIEYVSRLRKTSSTKRVVREVKEGKVDIVIGTHRLVGKDVEFKDLGLLIIDEEQRFGVAVKEKLKRIKVNVDTLTLTATPIPRTLQFSLMGARDLSILNTAPPNRHPIITELHTFNEAIIREAISYELERNGQVFFINNRVHNIYEMEKAINQWMPEVKTVVAHGQMEGAKLEKIMMEFIEGEYDVLIATTIIESGLDIANANTIIINNAHHFGLSELHQLRGRVGRSNKKAFCYLLAPPSSTLTQDARRRLHIIEEFSELGSGFNIAMQDLDIRGAGNMLGAEQSGYIADIGYETYQRILQEAMLELREDEFPELFKDEPKPGDETTAYTRDCQIETDEAVRIPEDYVSNTAERMDLYRELDNIEKEEELKTFENNLTDRFGAIPESTQSLLDVVRVRMKAKTMGITRLLFKNHTARLHFIDNQQSGFYQSETFGKVLQWIQQHPREVQMQQKNEKLVLTIKNIKGITNLLNKLNEITTPSAP